MAQVIAVCDGTLSAVGSAIECSGTWVAAEASSIPGLFDITALNPEYVLGYFGAGFIVAGIPMIVGLAITPILSAIRGK